VAINVITDDDMQHAPSYVCLLLSSFSPTTEIINKLWQQPTIPSMWWPLLLLLLLLFCPGTVAVTITVAVTHPVTHSSLCGSSTSYSSSQPSAQQLSQPKHGCPT
jgi:hypothetical protein